MRLIFDLDGTLTDPFEGIADSIAYAFRQMGREVPERESLRRFVGPPLVLSFREFLGMSEAEAEEAQRLYRVYYAEGGLFENRPYDGIGEALCRLRDAGHILCVATSKPEPFARRILERFRLDGYFREICGASLDGTRSTKAEVLRELLGRLGEDGGPTLMIGDRRHDAEGAAEFGIPALGVLWGFGSEEELAAAGCVRLARTPGELADILLAGDPSRR